jgi:hypothetical protein
MGINLLLVSYGLRLGVVVRMGRDRLEGKEQLWQGDGKRMESERCMYVVLIYLCMFRLWIFLWNM